MLKLLKLLEEMSVMLRLKLSLLLRLLQLKMKLLLSRPPSHMLVPKFNFQKMKQQTTQLLLLLQLMPCSKKKNHGRK